MYRNNKGITIIALTITIVLMLILVVISIEFGTEGIDKARLEDMKTNMLSIKTKAKTINEKVAFGDETEDKLGILIDDISILNSALQSKLNTEKSYYKVDSNVLNKWGLSDIKLNNSEFYIVDYDFPIDKDDETKGTTCEVYFSEGFEYNGKIYYSLTELQEIKD